MAGDTWTLDSIWLHFTSAMKDKEAKDMERLATNEKNVSKALADLDKRFEKVNEFRGALTDLQSTYMPKSEAYVIIENLKDRIGKIEEENLKSASKGQGSNSVWLLIVAIVSFVSLILGIYAHFK